MNTTPDDDFVTVVCEIITELRDNATVTNAEIVSQIAEAYEARVGRERDRTQHAEASNVELLARESALQECGSHMKGIISQLAVVNSRAHTHLAHQVAQVEAIRTLVLNLEETPSPTVPAQDILRILSRPYHQILDSAPIPVGISVDHRRSGGAFLDTRGRVHHFPFIGWGVVVSSLFLDTTIEPVFRVGVEAISRSVLARTGYQLQAMV